MSCELNLEDGQVYRWRWADDALHYDRGAWGAYHCKSQIAVVRSGRLFDTYWGDNSREISLAGVELTLLCDETWPQIPESQVYYYDANDVVDTRHANSSHAPIYLRPGALRSKAAILETLAWREEKANSEIRSAEWRKGQIDKARKLLADGKIDEVCL